MLVGGLPGTGKTTVAGGVADRLGAVLLSSDRVRKELAGLNPTDPAAADTATASTGRSTPTPPTRPCSTAPRTCSAGARRSCSTPRGPPPGAGTRLLRSPRGPRRTWWRCAATLPGDLADARIRSRRGSASDATPLVAAVMSADADPWPEATTVDTSGPADDSVATAVTAVRAPRRHGSWTVVEV